MRGLAVVAELADPGKRLVSLLGVVSSVVLVNRQGGLLFGMLSKRQASGSATAWPTSGSGSLVS